MAISKKLNSNGINSTEKKMEKSIANKQHNLQNPIII